jgi:hypothetical protein
MTRPPASDATDNPQVIAPEPPPSATVINKIATHSRSGSRYRFISRGFSLD